MSSLSSEGWNRSAPLSLEYAALRLLIYFAAKKRENALEVFKGNVGRGGEIDAVEKLGVGDADDHVVRDDGEEERRAIDELIVVVDHMINIFGRFFELFFGQTFADVLENRLNHQESAQTPPQSSRERFEFGWADAPDSDYRTKTQRFSSPERFPAAESE